VLKRENEDSGKREQIRFLRKAKVDIKAHELRQLRIHLARPKAAKHVDLTAFFRVFIDSLKYSYISVCYPGSWWGKWMCSLRNLKFR
jgi:hypothetical protein